MDDIIDEVIESKPETLVPNIDDHIFNIDDEYDDNMGKDNGKMDAMNDETNSERLRLVRPCLMDLVDKG
jgi:hypothetical protein